MCLELNRVLEPPVTSYTTEPFFFLVGFHALEVSECCLTEVTKAVQVEHLLLLKLVYMPVLSKFDHSFVFLKIYLLVLGRDSFDCKNNQFTF